jgi:5-methylcytosine-specific restriction endonuclease McrA
MKNKELNAVLVWKQMEDQVVPRLRLTPVDHAIYSYLLRHSRLEGKLRLRFSIPWLAHGARVCPGTAREAVRRLVAKGALRLVERSKAGHIVEARLPEEIRAVRTNGNGTGNETRLAQVDSLEETDFLESKELREAIHAREGGACFYCLRRVTTRTRCLDHVVPRVRSGRNSYPNLVSACGDCNSQKGEEQAEDFLRGHYRRRRLTADELEDRLRKLDALAAGQLRPDLPTPQSNAGAQKPSRAYERFPVGSQPLPRKPRPPIRPENLGAFARRRKPR